MLRVRVPHFPGESLGVIVERLADGLFYDPKALAFAAAVPATPIPLAPVAASGVWAGIYRVAIDTTPAPPGSWPDGGYAVYVLNATSGQVVMGPIGAVLRNGDDAPVFPPSKLSGTLTVS
jgi:hypothetical protein